VQYRLTRSKAPCSVPKLCTRPTSFALAKPMLTDYRRGQARTVCYSRASQVCSRIIIAMGFASALTAQIPAHIDLERQLWTSIKQALTGPDGHEYFESSMKGAMLPRLKGTLVSAVPNDGRNALILALTDSSTPEVALLLHDLPSELLLGKQIEFEGVAIGFTRDPLLVTFDVEEATRPVSIAPSWYAGPALGIVRSGRYRNRSTRVEFDLPSHWIVQGTRPSIDNGDVAILTNSRFEGSIAGV
jgi:hypothetical protein